MLKKLLGIVVLGLLFNENAYARPYNEGGNPWIYGLAILCFFVIGALISPVWKLFEKNSKKNIYDRQNSSHAHMFQAYPKYKGRYIEVEVLDRNNPSDADTFALYPKYKPRYIEIPISKKERERFWKIFHKKFRQIK